MTPHTSPICPTGDNGQVNPNALAIQVAQACQEVHTCRTREDLDAALDILFDQHLNKAREGFDSILEIASVLGALTGGLAARAAVGGVAGVGGTTASATSGMRAGAADALRQLIAKKAGFSGKGQRLIVDENMSPSIAGFLRDHGYDARSVSEMGLRGTKDDKLMQLAEQLGAKVVTRDRGRQMDGGFGTLAIQIDRRVSSPEEILRIITSAK
ncbi:hypothetical protein B0I31_10971 [Saccharothrix carnea]|uniref:DUF5615 domain-containing protein n=1 Tax=Saccharothrix carnea TaxID=1280637 RepID=A0A2P8I497_SACCR|nr:hypothetical protein B0I31_10971 [Saccharothrix carnea]